MGWEEFLTNPIVLLAIGWAAGEWQRSRDANTKAVKVDADVLARLAHVESWQRDHNSIHGCVRELSATVQAMAKTVDRLTRRLDNWMAANRAPLRHRSPYETPDMRDWVVDE